MGFQLSLPAGIFRVIPFIHYGDDRVFLSCLTYDLMKIIFFLMKAEAEYEYYEPNIVKGWSQTFIAEKGSGFHLRYIFKEIPWNIPAIAN